MEHERKYASPAAVIGFALILWLSTGCALTPHAFHLRSQERLYNETLSHIKPGQTRADLIAALPQTTTPVSINRYRPRHGSFDSERYKIDSDFCLYVDFAYRQFQQIPDPSVPPQQSAKLQGAFTSHEPVVIYAIGDIRPYPHGTPYCRIHLQEDDRIVSIAPRVSRYDGRWIYITPRQRLRFKTECDRPRPSSPSS